MNKKKKGKTLNKVFMKYLVVALAIISLIAMGLLFFIDLLPIRYCIVLTIIVLIIEFFIAKIMVCKNIVRNVIGSLLAIILIIFMILGINYELNTLGFLKQFGFNSYKTEHYNVVVLKTSEYEEIEDLKDKTIARLSLDNREGLEKANKKLLSKINFEVLESNDISDEIDHLMEKEADAIILEDTQMQIISEENNDVYNDLKIIYTIEIEIEIKEIGEEVDVTKNAFNVYISGIDTFGSITKISRSDVNMVATVNPNTHEILLTNIPRDYYVELAGYSAFDKLTHAGIYGIDTSLKTIENLLDIKINYYIRVNFSSMIEIVDALGGIEVDSAYAFTSKDGYRYTKGVNKLDGKRALSFSRERDAFMSLGGDRVRGENQQRVLSALIDKAMGPSIITKYNELLNSLKDNFVTNIDNSTISDFVKQQINEPASWAVNSIALDGSDSREYTYSYKNSTVYVMKPDPESVYNATVQINSVLNK